MAQITLATVCSRGEYGHKKSEKMSNKVEDAEVMRVSFKTVLVDMERLYQIIKTFLSYNLQYL